MSVLSRKEQARKNEAFIHAATGYHRVDNIYSSWPGGTPDQCVHEALSFSEFFNKKIFWTHNGRKVPVRPDDDPEELVKRMWKELNQPTLDPEA